LQANIGC